MQLGRQHIAEAITFYFYFYYCFIFTFVPKFVLWVEEGSYGIIMPWRKGWIRDRRERRE